MVLREIVDLLTSRDGRVVLELDLARGLVEVRPRNPLAALQILNATGMATLRDHLSRAARDDRVAGLIVHAVECGQPMPVMEEVGDLVEEFGRHKPTVAWAESYGELGNSLSAYLLATAAHKVWVQPSGDLGIGGAEVSIVLAKGMLEKAGITPQFGKRWEYKTAADQFAADDVTEANREMMTRLGQSLVEEAVTTIARRRGIDAARVWEGVNDSPLTPERAQDLGLVDRIGYRDEVYTEALDEWHGEPEDLRFVHRWSPKRDLAKVLRRSPGGKVAVVSVRGSIVTGRGAASPLGGESVGSDVVDEHLRAVLRDDDIRAVILDINSPGGSAVASDFMRRSVLRVRESGRPVIARMGAVAASGGYYAAMGADEIVAQASTLTGSIGVLAGKFVTAGLYEKLGLKRESIRIGARAGMLSSSTPFTEDDWAKLDESLDRIYETFTSLAAHDRGMELDELRALAKGRVWTGADAAANGLVDHIGGWRLAWERACILADLNPETASITRLSHFGPFERLMPATSSESRSTTSLVPAVGSEDLLMRAATWLGLPVNGALSLPGRIDVG
ncbi:signal peptide peptidase SppA [Tessaracoccus antarcticus]|uniref:Signal peptide peptidase SppA n=1 Tax=Tessaracoccus antarcticus TaxID=2479848 RepID=A0A3M0G0A8_9ACTN|nr:signal peptide peptidase SppA [Tessaracoccus antarcticus]RMB58411.1 signal peptide peptidase SppA [Tessaracoccus antarcticus]